MTCNHAASPGVTVTGVFLFNLNVLANRANYRGFKIIIKSDML